MKTLLYVLFIYFLYRIIRKAFQPVKTHKVPPQWTTNVQSTPQDPPPYDAANVEDIDFESTKSRKRDS